MKKAIPSASAILILALVASHPASAQVRFVFKLGGGLAYAGGGDVNADFQGIAAAVNDIYGHFPGIMVRDVHEPFHWGPDVRAEFLVQIDSGFALGIGSGYGSISKESSMTVADGSDATTPYWRPEISVVPLTLNLHYAFPISGGVRFVLTAGLGLYFAGLDVERSPGP